MPPLAELQRAFAQAVLGGETLAGLSAGPVSPAEALSVHRDTVTGALVQALRLSYPTVDALGGEAFFDQAASIFAQANPPRTASLSDYGGGFAEFLAGFSSAAALPYLADVARLDRAIEAALRAPPHGQSFALDDIVSIELPQSLMVLRLAYAADEIRAGIGDDAALARISIAQSERFILVWRKDWEAAVRRVSAPAGRFLNALLNGLGAEEAFGAASADTPQANVIRALQAEIFTAPFCTVSQQGTAS